MNYRRRKTHAQLRNIYEPLPDRGPTLDEPDPEPYSNSHKRPDRQLFVSHYMYGQSNWWDATRKLHKDAGPALREVMGWRR